MRVPSHIEKLLAQYAMPKLDIGCGQNKNPGFIGMDFENFPGVDVVHNCELFPWPFPDSAFVGAVTSHVVEHINPTAGDARIPALISLLLKKKVVTPKEVEEFIGEVNPGPLFVRFMDEVWRVLKPGAQFAMVYPYAGSPGFWQDPSHINGINEMTWWYFDPEEPHVGAMLYKFYKPKPWKLVRALGQKGGNMEVILEKRDVKPEYSEGTPADAYEEKMEESTLVVDMQR